jgi:hypothetical protein
MRDLRRTDPRHKTQGQRALRSIAHEAGLGSSWPDSAGGLRARLPSITCLTQLEGS